MPITRRFAVILAGLLLMPAALRAQDAIRQPTGNVEQFWDALDWADLNAAEQEAWSALGWNEASWDQNTDIPASDTTDWSELSDEEREAATRLGYDVASWNSN